MQGRANEERCDDDQEFNDHAYCNRHHMDLGKNINKPKMKMSTQYQSYFQRFKAKKTKMDLFIPKQTRAQVVSSFDSEYLHSYQGKTQQRRKKQRPSDQIRVGGNPLFSLTSNKAEFVGHHGMNQYVKVKNEKMDNFTKTDFRTTYSSSFQPTRHKKEEIRSQTPSKTFMRTNFDRSIVQSTCKSSYSLQFKKKNYSELKQHKADDIIDPETFSNSNEAKIFKKSHDYSSNILFNTAEKTKPNQRAVTVYEVDFSLQGERKSSCEQKKRFKVFQKKQIEELRKKMRTCYC